MDSNYGFQEAIEMFAVFAQARIAEVMQADYIIPLDHCLTQ